MEMWLLLALLAVGTAANIDCKFSLFTIIIIMSQSSKQEQTHGRKIKRFSSTVIYILFNLARYLVRAEVKGIM